MTPYSRPRHAAPQPARLTVPALAAMARDGTKIAMLTAYDASFAALASAPGVDVLLVGDSLGMVIQGHDSTLPVTLGDVLYHTRCVAAGCARPLVIADLPFGSYQAESRRRRTPRRRRRSRPARRWSSSKAAPGSRRPSSSWSTRGVPVCGHVGLQPQSVNALGGYRVQGKTADAAAALLADARALVAAGRVDAGRRMRAAARWARR